MTGGSAGIGAATVRGLAEGGARVAAIARDAERLAALANATGVVPVVGDLTHTDGVPRLVDRAVEQLGGLDGVVNNAGVFLLGFVSDGEPRDWREMLDLNVLGLLAVTQATIPHLRSATSESKTIVNVSSLGGRRVAQPAQGVYAATKHAVHAISAGLREELFDDGIAVTVIAPGFVRTNLGAGITDDLVRQNMRRGQLDQGLHPDDVAREIVHVLGLPPDVHLTEIGMMSRRQRPV